MSEVTHILNEIESGDPAAAEKLLALVYAELRRLASRHKPEFRVSVLGGEQNHTFNAPFVV